LKYNPQDPGDILIALRTLARQWLIPTEGPLEAEKRQTEDDNVDRLVKEQLVNMR
jgi:hypothetical protein